MAASASVWAGISGIHYQFYFIYILAKDGNDISAGTFIVLLDKNRPGFGTNRVPTVFFFIELVGVLEVGMGWNGIEGFGC